MSENLDAALGNDARTHKLCQLFIVEDGELDVARLDRLLLVLKRRVARELKHFAGEVLENSSHKDSTSLSRLFTVATLLKVAVYATNRERNSCFLLTRSILSASGSLGLSWLALDGGGSLVDGRSLLCFGNHLVVW